MLGRRVGGERRVGMYLRRCGLGALVSELIDAGEGELRIGRNLG